MKRRILLGTTLGLGALLGYAGDRASAQTALPAIATPNKSIITVAQPLPSTAQPAPAQTLPSTSQPASSQPMPTTPPASAAPAPAPIPHDAPFRETGVPEAGATPSDPLTEPAPLPFKYSWGGQYRILPNSSNFSFQPLFITNDQRTQTFVNQRMRVWATVETDEHVEGYIQMQIGGIDWGQNYDFSKSFVGPRFPAGDDRVGILLRRGWVAYHDDDWGKIRAGFLDWHDSFGDTLASSDYDFNIGGVDWTKIFKEYNNLKIVAGGFLLTDLALVSTQEDQFGAHDSMLFTLDVDQPLGCKSSVGASVYFEPDLGQYSYPTVGPYKSSYDTWVGVRGKTVAMDTVPLSAFALINSGYRTDFAGTTVFKHTGAAAKFEIGPVPIGPGKFSVQTLYASGSDHPGVGNTSEFRTVAQSYRDNFGAQGYWSYLYITSPNGPSDVNDLGVSLQDRGLGLVTVQGKYEYPLTKRLTGISSVGWLQSANHNPRNGNNDIGTEIAQQFTFNFGGGLKLDAGAAYLFTGDFYKESPVSASPSDTWELFARLQLEF